jgi:hypothetical protein
MTNLDYSSKDEIKKRNVKRIYKCRAYELVTALYLSTYLTIVITKNIRHNVYQEGARCLGGSGSDSTQFYNE